MMRSPPCYEFDRRIRVGLPADVGNSIDNTISLPGITSTVFTNPLVLAGADEVGRGPLAGPVVAAAVILPEDPVIHGLRDSKVVPEEQREALYCQIIETAISYSVVAIDNKEIDILNILEASMKAMREAVRSLTVQPDLLVVDGNQKCGAHIREMTFIKGDGKSASIMAASILAKVTRDQFMIDLHDQYPQYGFDEHKGYACQKHLDALEKYGPSPYHRFSFSPVRAQTQKDLLEI